MIQRYTPAFNRWDPFSEMAQLQRAMNCLFHSTDGGIDRMYPAVNVHVDEESAIVTVELPGIDAEKLEISTDGNALTLSGSREVEPVPEGASYYRQERFSGRFTRTIELPFNVEAEKVKARLRNGILEIEAPRAEADKPRKITIETN